jgi:hypothetical protein
MAIHATIDLETLDITPNATVLTLGGVKFNPHNTQEPHSKIYFKISVDDQDRLGRTASDSTIEWWSKQDPEIMAEAFDQNNAITVEKLCEEIARWAVGVDLFWGQGYGFDFTMLEDMFRSVQRPIPWQFWQIRDSRTLFGLCKLDPRKSMQTNLHNAADDAYYQAKAVQLAYRELGVTK